MHSSRYLIAAVLFGMTGTGAIAVADTAPDEIIIVTATRTEIPLRDALIPVSVISREDIELSLASDLAELLRFQAGIDLGRNGGPGQATSIFIRGTESNHTLVLLDGVRINPGTLGGAAIQHIAPELIERVEIVKGARSALFGTDAIGGVVNIITRRDKEAYFESSAGMGSLNTQSALVSGGNQGARGSFGFAVNWQDTDGYAPRLDSDVKRGYDNLSGNIQASRKFGNNEIGIRHWQTQGTVEYLDYFLTPLDQDFENTATALELSSRISDRASSKLLLAYMTDNITQNQLDDFVRSNRVSVDWQYSHSFAQHTLTGGLFGIAENASALSFGSGFDEDTAVRAMFVQDQWAHGRHRAFVAGRLTHHETFGNHVTWNAEYGFAITDEWSVNAGLGHAFRAPDATDRYGYGGNVNLEPELADEAQFGLRFDPGNGHRIDIEWYRNDIDDLIEFDLESFTLKNISAAQIEGVEIGYEYRGDGFLVHAAVNQQQADNAQTGERLLRRAEKSASFSYTRDLGQHRVGISIAASGDRVDFGGVKLPGYALANLTAQFALGPRWALCARIENLLDTEYQTAAGFRMQERGSFVELRYRRN